MWGSAPHPGRAKFALHPRHVRRTCLIGTCRRHGRTNRTNRTNKTACETKLPNFQTPKLPLLRPACGSTPLICPNLRNLRFPCVVQAPVGLCFPFSVFRSPGWPQAAPSK